MTLNDPTSAKWVAWNPDQSMFAPNSGFATRTWSNITGFGIAPQLREFVTTKNSSIANWDGMRTAGLWMYASYDTNSAALPVARLGATPTSGNVPLSVNFDASTSTSAVSIRNYLWDFGDGVVTTTTAATTDHAYGFAGVFVATVTMRDELERESSVSIQITVRDPTTGSSGSEIAFVGPKDITLHETTQLNVAIARTGDTLGTISVTYRIEHISSDNNDIITAIRRVSWASGDSANKMLIIDFNANDGVEELERMRIILTEPYGGARIGAANTLEIFLADAVAPPLNPQSSDQNNNDSSGPNVGGIVVGVIVAIVVVAAIGLAVWKRIYIRTKLGEILKA
jgi:PKD repeat protein